MSEETIADILAEMFDFSDKRIEEGRDHAMTSESVGLIVHQLAKRFEAAWKRESAGNVAAMRDALVSIAKVPVPPIRIRVSSPGPGIIIHEPEPESEWLAMLRECVKRANAALAAPARNCEKYTSYKDAYDAWNKSLTFPQPIARFGIWLMETAGKGVQNEEAEPKTD